MTKRKKYVSKVEKKNIGVFQNPEFSNILK